MFFNFLSVFSYWYLMASVVFFTNSLKSSVRYFIVVVNSVCVT